MLGQIAAFTVAATLVTLSPGPDMALVARRAITDGWRRASVTSAGIVSGLLVHATASAAGISVILVRSATAFTVLKIVGACYLVVLGILSFRAARRTAREPAELVGRRPAVTVHADEFRAGLPQQRPQPEAGALLPRVHAPVLPAR
jgi:threonine/homoserine/homoserine lactone efflux protein